MTSNKRKVDDLSPEDKEVNRANESAKCIDRLMSDIYKYCTMLSKLNNEHEQLKVAYNAEKEKNSQLRGVLASRLDDDCALRKRVEKMEKIIANVRNEVFPTAGSSSRAPRYSATSPAYSPPSPDCSPTSQQY